MALAKQSSGFYNKSMKNILTLFIISLLCTLFPAPSNAQGMLGAVKKAIAAAKQKLPSRSGNQAKRAAAAEKKAAQKAVKTVQRQQIAEAVAQANRAWKARNFQVIRDKNALGNWALAQSLRKTSPLYQAAVKDVAFVRAHASAAAPYVKRDVVHVNSVPYFRLAYKANRIFIATDINDGSRWQLSKLVQAVRQGNPGKKLVVASPYFPESKQLFTAGSYARFQQENGTDILVQTILAQGEAILIPLKQQPGGSVQNNLRAWTEILQPHYEAASFGRTDEVLIVIAPAKFIEGSAGSLRKAYMAPPFLNKDISLTFSIRTNNKSNLTDYKWGMVMARTRYHLKAPYQSGWTQNAFVEEVPAQIADAVGTNYIIRVCP